MSLGPFTEDKRIQFLPTAVLGVKGDIYIYIVVAQSMVENGESVRARSN